MASRQVFVFLEEVNPVLNIDDFSDTSAISAIILGTFFLGGGGLGPQRGGSSVKRALKEEGHTISYSRGGSHTFSRIFNGNFCDVIFHFSLTD